MISETEAQENTLEYLGRDIKMYEDDIVFGTQNDFAFVTFRNNLSQALMIRLRTQEGEITLHTNYGSLLPDLISQPPTENTLYKVRETIRATLLQEPRIDDISNIKVEKLSDGTIQATIEVKPILQKNTMNLIYDLFQE